VAESGSFAISQAGAEIYLKAIEDVEISLNDLNNDVFHLRQETKLGTGPDAQAMSRYYAESTGGGNGPDGIVPAIDQLTAALMVAKAALRKAIETTAKSMTRRRAVSRATETGMQLSRNLVVRSVLPVAVVGVVLAGCSSKTPGDASAVDETTTTTTTTTTSERTTTTSASGGRDGLANFDPCAELNAVADRLSLSRIEKGGKQECDARWGETTTKVSVKALPELGVGEVVLSPGAQSSDLTVGSHRAKRAKGALSSTDCLVTVEITEKSRVDVIASSTSSVDEACDAATQVATAVEPKLPK